MNQKSAQKNDLAYQVDEGSAVLTLVGMSNTGKSYISEKLAKELGFQWICVDDLIEQELEPRLKRFGYRGIQDVAEWMGQPYEAYSAKNQQIYLDFETEIMNGIIDGLNKRKSNGNLVIDTTGSVVHTGVGIRDRLRASTTVIYIEVGKGELDEMFQEFVQKPKPIVWADVFDPDHDYESDAQAVRAYYPKLLKLRSDHYASISHIRLPRSTLQGITASDFIREAIETKA